MGGAGGSTDWRRPRPRSADGGRPRHRERSWGAGTSPLAGRHDAGRHGDQRRPGDALDLPAGALVLLVGPAGSGKSTFARRCFRPTEILSSDAFRAMVSDDPGDQSASREAFGLLHRAAAARLRRGRLTVIDATNLLRSARLPLLTMAERLGRPAVAIVFETSLERCLEWNARRDGRSVPPDVIRHQHRLMARTRAQLPHEGYGLVVGLPEPGAAATSVAPPPVAVTAGD